MLTSGHKKVEFRWVNLEFHFRLRTLMETKLPIHNTHLRYWVVGKFDLVQTLFPYLDDSPIKFFIRNSVSDKPAYSGLSRIFIAQRTEFKARVPEYFKIQSQNLPHYIVSIPSPTQKSLTYYWVIIINYPRFIFLNSYSIIFSKYKNLQKSI